MVRLNPGTRLFKRSSKRLVYFCLSVLLLFSGGLYQFATIPAEAGSPKLAQQLIYAAIPKEDPGPPGSLEKLAKGKFLVASRRLNDPNFSQTVVLLIDYGPDGAMGLVVNRPSTVKLSAVFPDVKELKKRKDTVYIGGPVAVNQMLMLVRSSQAPEASTPVIDGVYISSSWKVLEHLIKKATADQHFRLFAGYAGWAPNQLDFERSRGDWHILKADADSVFAQDPKALWQEMIRRATIKWVRLQEAAPTSN